MRLAVAGFALGNAGAAFDDVGEVDAAARKPHGFDDLRKQLTRFADKRFALQIFLLAGSFAHELGHNFGRNHAPCGSPPNVDPAYPYPGADIGTLGCDIFSPASPWSPFRPTTTLSVYIYKLQSEGLGSHVNEIIDGSAAILISMVLIFNLGARFIGRALTRRLTAA